MLVSTKYVLLQIRILRALDKVVGMNVRLGSVAFVLLANVVATCVADEAADVSVCFVPGDAFFSALREMKCATRNSVVV